MATLMPFDDRQFKLGEKRHATPFCPHKTNPKVST